MNALETQILNKVMQKLLVKICVLHLDIMIIKKKSKLKLYMESSLTQVFCKLLSYRVFFVIPSVVY